MPNAPVSHPPGSGRRIHVLSDLYTFKASAKDTGGAYLLLEAVVPPGGGTPPHVHRREDEAFYVLDGELTFRVGGEAIVARPGHFVHAPRDVPHQFTNTGKKPARALVWATPAGIEGFFLEVGSPPGAAPLDAQRVLAAAPKYGIEILV
ncbi:MAG: quercetin 2,3-dioxygenase [Planctomycetota bacterium]